MKIFKQTLAVLLSLIIVVSCIAVVSAADTSSSTTGAGNTINFNSGNWKNFNEVYCHIWVRGKDAFYSWQSKGEKCTGSGKNWSYDASRVQLKDGTDYCIIFSTDIGQETYDATFGKECIGDTLKVTDNKIENPIDSNKKKSEAIWLKNSGKYGPHLVFTSIGNIVGSKLCPNENGVEVIGDWLLTYSNSFMDRDMVAALAKAFPKFGITKASQLQDIDAYILNKKSRSEMEGSWMSILKDAFAKAYPAKKSAAKIDEKAAEKKAKQIFSNGGHVLVKSLGSYSSYYSDKFSLKKKKATVYVNKTYKIKFKKKKGAVSYKSSKKSVATVKNGKIYPKKAGKVTITVQGIKKKVKLKVTVKKPYVKKKTITVNLGKKKKIKIIGKNKYTLYKSRNNKIASVTKKGVIKGKKRGTVKIIILTNGTSISKVTSLETEKTTTTMKNGIKLVLTVKVK